MKQLLFETVGSKRLAPLWKIFAAKSLAARFKSWLGRSHGTSKFRLDMADDQDSVELVTLRWEQMTHGLNTPSARPFRDMASALRYAKSLSADNREASWIRVGNTVRTLEEAEGRQGVRTPKNLVSAFGGATRPRA
jgi:hypothetical protein